MFAFTGIDVFEQLVSESESWSQQRFVVEWLPFCSWMRMEVIVAWLSIHISSKQAKLPGHLLFIADMMVLSFMKKVNGFGFHLWLFSVVETSNFFIEELFKLLLTYSLPYHSASMNARRPRLTHHWLQLYLHLMAFEFIHGGVPSSLSSSSDWLVEPARDFKLSLVSCSWAF